MKKILSFRVTYHSLPSELHEYIRSSTEPIDFELHNTTDVNFGGRLSLIISTINPNIVDIDPLLNIAGNLSENNQKILGDFIRKYHHHISFSYAALLLTSPLVQQAVGPIGAKEIVEWGIRSTEGLKQLCLDIAQYSPTHPDHFKYVFYLSASRPGQGVLFAQYIPKQDIPSLNEQTNYQRQLLPLIFEASSQTSAGTLEVIDPEHMSFGILKAALAQDPTIIYHVLNKILEYPPDQQFDLFKTATTKNGFILDAITTNRFNTNQIIPINLFAVEQQEELCLLAITSNAFAMNRGIPNRFNTALFYGKALDANSEVFRHIPHHHQQAAKNIAETIATARAEALKAKKQKTKEHTTAVAPDYFHTPTLQLAPIHGTPEDIQVKTDGFNLRTIPVERRTEKLCLFAVSQNGNAISWVPDERRTDNVILTALFQNLGAWSYLNIQQRERVLTLLQDITFVELLRPD